MAWLGPTTLRMPRPGIELTAELHLLEGPFKDALPIELHGRGLGKYSCI